MTQQSIYKTPAGETAVLSLYDAALERWPVAREERMVQTRHGNTFVITSGTDDAPDLVLIHGAASNASSWIGDVSAYSRHFRVHAVDLPGEPGRSVQVRLSSHDDSYATWLRDVLEELGIGTAALLGISHGGFVAVRFASLYPELARSLVLLAPGGIVPTRPAFLLRAVLLSFMGRSGARSLNRHVMGNQDLHPEALRVMDTIMEHFVARVEREYLFTDEELARLTMPVLFVGGEADVIRSSGDIEFRLRASAPDVHSVILPHAGHCLVNTTGTVLPFLTAHGRPSAAEGGE